MGQTSGQLREEIDHKRDDAAAKIDQIETRVHDTAEMAKDTVDRTMQSAKETVTETVNETVDTVKHSVESFDFNQQIQERPLLALGAAVLGGFLLGGMTGGEQRHRQPSYDSDSHTSYGGMRHSAKKSGLDDTVSAMSGVLMGMAADRIQGVVEQTFPEFGQRLRQRVQQHQSESRSAPRSETTGSAWANQAPGSAPTESRR